MAVYVDNARIRFGRMLMCHMVADTNDELHEMAAKIGISRDWFQENVRHPHYDVCASKRIDAIKAGAIEVDRREIVKLGVYGES